MTIYLQRGDHGTRGDGAKGDWIVAWQAFLAGEGMYEGDYSPNFGPRTAEATKSFQDSLGFVSYEHVTRNELMPALNKGFDPPDSWLQAALDAGDIDVKTFHKLRDSVVAGRATEKSTILATWGLGYKDPNYPQPSDLDGDGRADLVYLKESERQKLWGPLEWRTIDGMPIATNSWYAENIVGVHVPQLVGVDCYGSPSSGRAQFHKKAAPQFMGAMQEIEDAGLLDDITSFGGTYVFRFIRGSTRTLSNHSFGVAIDFNMKENGLGKQPALVGQKGTLRRLVKIFERWGFFWGGWYKGRKDGMHFECVELFTHTRLDSQLAELSTADHIYGLVEMPK